MLNLDAVSQYFRLQQDAIFFGKIELTYFAKLFKTGQMPNIIVMIECFCHVKEGSNNVNF